MFPAEGRSSTTITDTTAQHDVHRRAVSGCLVAGASRASGAETAKASARAAMTSLLGAHDTHTLGGGPSTVTAPGGRAVATKTDVGDVESMRALVELALVEFGRLDAAFNNATDGPMPARSPTSTPTSSTSPSASTCAERSSA